MKRFSTKLTNRRAVKSIIANTNINYDETQVLNYIFAYLKVLLIKKIKNFKTVDIAHWKFKSTQIMGIELPTDVDI